MSLLQKLLSIGMYNQQPKQIQQRQPQLNPDFKGVYRPVGNTLQEVYCPRCGRVFTYSNSNKYTR